jgi:tartrate-resistant acid phosphatase type 5
MEAFHITINNRGVNILNCQSNLEMLSQVLYGNNEPRWVFPNRWHDWVYQDPAGYSVHFFVIDTQSLRWNINNPTSQLQWLDDALAASTSEWRVVIAHHPPYSAGNYGPGSSTISGNVSLVNPVQI